MQSLGLLILDESVDMIFTDPPYTEECLYLYGELAKLAQRVLRPGGSLTTFIGHYALEKIIDLIRSNSDSKLKYHWILAVKHNGNNTRMWKQRVWVGYKPLLWYYKLGAKNDQPTRFKDLADLIESKPVQKDNHEWEQSTVEAKHMIDSLTVENQIILDPFMGSGTTGEAALELERKFIGIEIDKVHYSNAAQRLVKFASLSNIASPDLVRS